LFVLLLAALAGYQQQLAAAIAAQTRQGYQVEGNSPLLALEGSCSSNM
jgi:hypothetical protein